MRIAFKINTLTVFLGVLISCGGVSPTVMAAGTAPASAPTVVPPSMQAAAPAQAGTAAAPSSGATLPAPPLPVAMDSKAAAAGGASNLAAIENKVPDSVKEIVKHLDKTTDDVTLEDLNSARQAVAKIEALIDIEKHLAELEKVRQERDKVPSFAGAIPASALQPAAMSGHAASAMQAPMPMPEKALEVSRIMGRNGHYSAVLKMADDKTKTVQTGDQLSDGSRIVGITATEVDLVHGGSHESLHVKNVDTLFGNS